MRILTVKTNPRGFQTKPLIVVAGKAISKKAVTRNLIRRRIMAIMRPLLGGISCDVAIIAHPEIAAVSFNEIKEEIWKQLNKRS